MMVIDRAGVDLIPLRGLISNFVLVFASLFIIFGGGIPYIFQYLEILERKNAQGFSLLVCLSLCIANILRVLFWFGKRFDIALLAQSLVMLTCMILMLEVSVRMNRKLLHRSQRSSLWRGDVIKHFWAWSDLSSYLLALASFTLVCSLITALLIEWTVYIEALGMVSLLVEASLGMPQLIRNHKRKSTTGMSVRMVLMWLLGDCGKTAYFVVRSSPAQFWICAILQITIDILILIQVYFYGKGPPVPYTAPQAVQ
uniref:Solute carrier family 66 member 2 n=1 Tax=Ascaris suum TaxID=6253 RepID=F1L6X5_ASCSU